MKNIYFVCLLLLSMASCKNDKKSSTDQTEQNTETKTSSSYTETTTIGNEFDTFTGLFLYMESENAAVLQTPNTMYGVVVDAQMKALNEQCKAYKNEDHDMIPVVVRGIKKPNSVENAWKEVIEIKQIVSVQRPKGNDGTIIIKNNQ